MDVQVNMHQVRAWEAIVDAQIGFATSKALNVTANDVQAEIQRGLEGRFILRRRGFVLRTIKIDPRERATKYDLRAVIRVDPQRNILAKFEAGGVKRARSGRRLAVPDEARRKRTDIVPAALRPKALKLRLHRTKAGKVQFKGEQRTFLVEKSTFSSGILQRVGRGRGSRVRVLYWFQRGVLLDPLLRFETTARRVVAQRFNVNFAEAMRLAIETAR